jgi:hypothetical protein
MIIELAISIPFCVMDVNGMQGPPCHFRNIDNFTTILEAQQSPSNSPLHFFWVFFKNHISIYHCNTIDIYQLFVIARYTVLMKYAF